MTALTDTQVITASGGLVELGYSQITNTVSVSSTFEGTSGTSVIPALAVVCDGSPILVEFVAPRVITGSNTYVATGLIVDGAFQGRMTLTASSNAGVLESPAYGSFRLTPSAGSHTFAVTAFRGSSNGAVHNDTSSRTYLRVSKIVQATQWPALTSGVIVCTSVTRPAAPTVGTFIFETDSLTLSVWNGSAWSPVNAQPTGTITSYAGSTSPSGWLLCDGAAVSRTTYASLFAALSTTYGVGNGSTTFNLPDLRGRIPMGAGTGAQNGGAGTGAISGGTSLTARTRGQFGGDERLQTHTHTGTTGNDSPDHNHGPGTGTAFLTTSGGAAYNFGSQAAAAQHTPATTGGASARHTHAFTTASHNQSLGTGQNMTPFLVTNYIIKV
jgi:microcystin-dependent protein